MIGTGLPTVALIAAFDTKGPDATFIGQELQKNGCRVVAIDIGVFESAVPFASFVRCSELLQGDVRIEELRRGNNQAAAVEAIKAAIKATISAICTQHQIVGLIGAGGTKGTDIITKAMRKVAKDMPAKDMPKVCISTVTQRENWRYTKVSDIILINSSADVGGVNAISRPRYAQAALILTSLVKHHQLGRAEQTLLLQLPLIGISMLGVTDKCVRMCSKKLLQAGFEPVPFHAVGTGGRSLEKYVKNGTIQRGVLDLTLHEIAAFLGNGLFSAGDQRLRAPMNSQVAHLLAPGGVDMVIFGDFEETRARYPARKLYRCTKQLTAMRTTPEENRQTARFIAERANEAFLKNCPVAILIPLKGFSMFDETLVGWCDSEANRAFAGEILQKSHPELPVKIVDLSINEEKFSEEATEAIVKLSNRQKLEWIRSDDEKYY